MKVLRLFVFFCLMLASFYGSAQDNTYTATYNDYSLDYHKINDICERWKEAPDDVDLLNEITNLLITLDNEHQSKLLSYFVREMPPILQNINDEALFKSYFTLLHDLVVSLLDYDERLTAMSMGRSVCWYRKSTSNDINEIRFLVFSRLDIATTLDSYITGQKFVKENKFVIPTWGLNALHYLENEFYGKDVFIKSIDPIPDDVLERLFVAFDDYSHYAIGVDPQYEVFNLIRAAYKNGAHRLIADNAEDIMRLISIVFPSVSSMTNDVTTFVRVAYFNLGLNIANLQELQHKIDKERHKHEVIDLYYAHMDVAVPSMENVIKDYEAHCERLSEAGCDFAEYWPWEWSGEISEKQKALWQEHTRFTIEFLRNIWQVFSISTYPEKDFEMIKNFLAMETLHQFIEVSLYLATIYYWEIPAVALEIIDRTMPICNTISYTPNGLADVASLYLNLGRMDEVKQFADNIFIPVFDQYDVSLEVPEYYAGGLHQLALVASILAELDGDIYKEKSRTYADQCLAHYENLSEQDLYEVALLLAGAYGSLEQYDISHQIVDKMISMTQDEHILSYLYLVKANNNYEMGNYGEAVTNLKKYYKIYPSDLSFSTVGNASMLKCAALAGDRELFRFFASEYITVLLEEINGNLLLMGVDQRDKFWNRTLTYHKDVVDTYRAISDPKDIETMARLFYDYSLIAKGILLGVNTQIDKYIKNHPDSTVRALYNQYLDLAMVKENQAIQSDLSSVVMSAGNAFDYLEQDIMSVLRSEGKVEFSYYTWQDVQARLDKNSVAIEFVRMQGEENDEARYVALLLRKGWKSPRIVELCSETQLMPYIHKDRRKSQRVYNTFGNTELYNLVWQPLTQYIKEGETVYFSVDGMLNLVNIEVLHSAGDNRLCDDVYDLHRLSSTRQLCISDDDGENHNASLFADLNYHMNAAERRDAIQNDYTSIDGDDVTLGRAAAGSVPRDSLPQSRIMINIVDSLLQCGGYRPTVYLGNEGVESTFKSLSGREIGVMHLYTHGFYIEGTTEYQVTEEELSPMMRAGLVMSGSPDMSLINGEDGLLLAREVADMDLSSVDLLFLSACETAQGEVTSDGVFGIQRGFKQAGVETIIMTLWEVNARMSEFLVESFYRYYTSGMSKREAFKQAREDTRNHPQYANSDWAAYIMID